VTSFVRRIRQFAEEDQQAASRAGGCGGFRAAKAVPITAPVVVNDAQAIVSFLTQYPCDERAQDFLTSSPPEVRARVMQEFRPRKEGDSDYSGAVTSFVRRIRQFAEEDQQAASRAGGCGGFRAAKAVPITAPAVINDAQAIASFLTRYPCDQRAQDFLTSSPLEVRVRVVHEFRPRKEGDSDYSGAVTSFVRRIRQFAEEDQQKAQGKGGWGPSKQPRLM